MEHHPAGRHQPVQGASLYTVSGRRGKSSGAGALWLALACVACSKYPTPGVPTNQDAFTHWLLTNAGEPREPGPCALQPIELGPTRMARPRDRQVQLPMPNGYAAERWNLPQDRMFFPAVGWQFGQEWTPGVRVIAAWDRWTHVAPHASSANALFQVLNRQGYQPFVVAEPWKLAVSPECILPLANRSIRVLPFELHHPTAPTLWGVVAYWRGRPGDGDLSALAIGSDPALQAEVLQILRRQIP